MEKNKQKKAVGDTHSYKGWLNSDSFLKRAFAIAGYYTVASMIITAILLIIMLIIGLFVGMIALLTM